MIPRKTSSNYIDTILARRDTNAQYLTELRVRGNVDKMDCFKLLEDRLQLRESAVFRLQEVHETFSSTSIRVQPEQNGCFIHIEHIEVIRHSETMYVSNAHELSDTLHQAERRWNRPIDLGRLLKNDTSCV
jgi:hypothetical protein